MNRLIGLILLFCGLSPISSQPSQNIVPITDKAYDLFDINKYDLSFNEKEYRLYVAKAKTTQNKEKKTPVLYILDGNGQFPMMVNQITETSSNFPLIVGIGYPVDKAYPKERTRDYTIPIEDNNEGGGAEPFYEFITNIVKPFIEEKYDVDTTRQTLCGHSHGGLFVLYVAFNHVTSFQNYVSASPSLWWGNGKIVPTSRPLFSSIPRSFTMTLGEYEENPSLDKSRKEMSPEVKAIKEKRKGNISARNLYQLISEEIPNSRFLLYEGKNHGSSVPLFLGEAIKVAAND